MADAETGEPEAPAPNSIGICSCGQLVVYDAELSVRLPTDREAQWALAHAPWLAQVISAIRARRALVNPN